MTTTTASAAPTTHHFLPIEAGALVELRATDDAGRPCVPFTDDRGGRPLRCCLRASEQGDSIALVSYAPLRRWAAERGARPGAYDEQGPVFIHAQECGGPVEGQPGYPFARTGALRALRRYDADGRIVGGRILEVPADANGAFERALGEAFEEEGVVLVHVRAVEFGCFLFEVRRG
ncbi:DUF1203 domain-containing protein [Streptomyces sp. NPDC048057]|uniref:DUF1203 domain-containing protein n=1 Tax=Streptomyces sp. NPDC048057 TaxID=3155628 RepID=UPI0033F3346C